MDPVPRCGRCIKAKIYAVIVSVEGEVYPYVDIGFIHSVAHLVTSNQQVVSAVTIVAPLNSKCVIFDQ